MKYVSTRGQAPKIGFSDAVLAGLAEDGGLYLPEKWPVFSPSEIRKLRGLPYPELVVRLLEPFIEADIESGVFESIVNAAYGGFRHPAVCPLVQTGPNEFMLELFHGPTLAFKDVAMQLLSRLMDHILEKRNRRATIVGATSGDTGGAAVEAFAGSKKIDVFILFPEGKVSQVQRRQMTTSNAANVHALAIRGNFDDCQSLVKAMFNDASFRQQVALSGVNSINWARIMAQIIYYFSSALSLGAPDRPVSFTVPTGNFGDIFAGFAAREMGLPIDRLVIATNENDILARTLASGRYETREVIATTSPSMDIQISSNFERLLFEASGRNPDEIVRYMESLKQSGSFTLENATLGKIRSIFSAGSASRPETASTLKRLFKETGYLADPHSSVGLKVARDFSETGVPMIVLATAHPSKFPDAVRASCGINPALPDWLDGLMEKKEHFEVLPSDLEMVEGHIKRHWTG